MADTTVIKVDAAFSPVGADGQKYLASGKTLSMRLWENEPPGEGKAAVRRDYETVGYAIAGRAELETEGQTVILQPGSSWVVPAGAEHRYRILEAFTAVEATSPPAQVHGRDETPAG
ncbi:cupin domain-containing protein [Roseomonas sp. BN140053]|uniref:cupin domain-containing protein n=1 Tax=Roseomonas sp. BN140053 TaxID=3391898 RepID=UPI0039EAA340